MTVAEITKLRKTWHYAMAVQDTASSLADATFNAAASGTTDDFPALREAVIDLVALTGPLATLWQDAPNTAVPAQSAPRK